ncbi:hypothetical protein [Actinopolymorpha rutila]|uniref:Uncharacterized protein n=1 Tax=Actinopolymorpha rutila TaxID=446787 RepID=A0A852Z8R1_9ACTN|nr:hypothetical protein [Actinopolymorpha rutila]NYH88242.1 hypothetical protein [Actinopolymorpha rutila]
MAQSGEDKLQIGLTSAGQRALDVLMADGRFATESDAYKFGIAYAIAVGLDLDDAPQGGYKTKYNASGGIDLDGVIRDLLDVLHVGDRRRPYATAEKLAELGVTAVAARLEGSETLADIISESQGSLS